MLFGPVNAFHPTTRDDLYDWFFKVSITSILGDAEIFLIDWRELSERQRIQVVQNHLLSVANLLTEKKGPDWLEKFVPLGFLAHSMPSLSREMDFSAPHSGTILFDVDSGALLYCASRNDNRLAMFLPELSNLSLAPCFKNEKHDPEELNFDYDDNSEDYEGFTFSQMSLLFKTMGLSEVPYVFGSPPQ